jgi:hypothetical protein
MTPPQSHSGAICGSVLDAARIVVVIDQHYVRHHSSRRRGLATLQRLPLCPVALEPLVDHRVIAGSAHLDTRTGEHRPALCHPGSHIHACYASPLRASAPAAAIISTSEGAPLFLGWLGCVCTVQLLNDETRANATSFARLIGNPLGPRY